MCQSRKLRRFLNLSFFVLSFSSAFSRSRADFRITNVVKTLAQNIEATEKKALLVKPQWFVESLAKAAAGGDGNISISIGEDRSTGTASSLTSLAGATAGQSLGSRASASKWSAPGQSSAASSLGRGAFEMQPSRRKQDGTVPNYGSSKGVRATTSGEVSEPADASPDPATQVDGTDTVVMADCFIDSSDVIMQQPDNARRKKRSDTSLGAFGHSGSRTLTGTVFNEPVIAQALHSSSFRTRNDLRHVTKLAAQR